MSIPSETIRNLGMGNDECEFRNYIEQLLLKIYHKSLATLGLVVPCLQRGNKAIY